jgi:hypothetical protein
MNLLWTHVMTRFLIALLILISSAANIAFAAAGDHVVVAKAEAGGTISPVGRFTIVKGESKKFKIEPTNTRVYEIDDVLVNGKSKGSVTHYTFSNLSNNQTITATFKKRIYKQKITNKNPSDGRLIYTGSGKLTYGKTFEIKAMPDKGYKAVITVDGYVVAKGEKNTFITHKLKIQKKHVIFAYFYKTTAPIDLNKTKPIVDSKPPASLPIVNAPAPADVTPIAPPSSDVTPVNLFVKLNWAVPTARTNGDALSLGDITGYEVYYTSLEANTGDVVVVSGATITSAVVTVPKVGIYYFSISTIDKAGQKSELSEPVQVTVK